MYRMKEEREIAPETFCHLISSTLYEKRFGPYFIEPVIAGLPAPTAQNPNPKPFIACTDLIGCITTPKDFVVAGTASEKLFGVAEGLWEPDLVCFLPFLPPLLPPPPLPSTALSSCAALVAD